jgi:hypothetical protein
MGVDSGKDDARRTQGPAGVSLPPQEKNGMSRLQAGGHVGRGDMRMSCPIGGLAPIAVMAILMSRCRRNC